MVTLLLMVKMLLLGGMVYMGLSIVEKWALRLVAASISYAIFAAMVSAFVVLF